MWVLIIFVVGGSPVLHNFANRDSCLEAQQLTEKVQQNVHAYCVPYQRSATGDNGPSTGPPLK